MGRGLNSGLNLLEALTAGSCSFCLNRLKRNYWTHDEYPGKNFCKKTCLNKHHKLILQMEDQGCSLCGKKKKSLSYYEDSYKSSKKYCKAKCYDIANSDAIVLRIEY